MSNRALAASSGVASSRLCALDSAVVGTFVERITYTKQGMPNPDSLPSETAFAWMVLVCNFSHSVGKIDACLFEVVGEFQVCRCLPNESELGLFKWRRLIVFARPDLTRHEHMESSGGI